MQFLQLVNARMEGREGCEVGLEVEINEDFVGDCEVDRRLAMFAVCEEED